MEFLDILKQIKNKIENYPELYLTNEQATRNQLIDPILKELGWDPTDPSKVLPNASNEDGKKPDYTLMHHKKPILILEAKNTSVELERQDVIKQLAQYCYNMGVKYGILSNGKEWLFYNTFETDPKKRILWKTDLTSNNLPAFENLFNILKSTNSDKFDELVNEYINSTIFQNLLDEVWEESFSISTINKISDIISKSIENLVKKKNPNVKIYNSLLNQFVNKKITDLFSYSEPINQYPETNKVENDTLEYSSSPDTKKEKIKVTFPDKAIIYSEKVVDTFVKTILKIGIEKVKDLGILVSNIPLIDTRKHPKYTMFNTGNYYIMVHTSTKHKYSILNNINRKLNLGLKIELI